MLTVTQNPQHLPCLHSSPYTPTRRHIAGPTLSSPPQSSHTPHTSSPHTPHTLLGRTHTQTPDTRSQQPTTPILPQIPHSLTHTNPYFPS